MNNYRCPLCKTIHDTTGCPPQQVTTSSGTKNTTNYCLICEANAEKYAELVEAAEKVKKAYETGLWGHPAYCNYQRPGLERCNCGIADLLTALGKVGGG